MCSGIDATMDVQTVDSEAPGSSGSRSLILGSIRIRSGLPVWSERTLSHLVPGEIVGPPRRATRCCVNASMHGK